MSYQSGPTSNPGLAFRKILRRLIASPDEDPDVSGDLKPEVAGLPMPSGADVDKAIAVTGIVGGALIATLVAVGAWVYDAVTEDDGVAGLDRPVLDWAISARTPSNEFWIAAFTNLGRTVPMVVLGVALTCAIYFRWRRRTAWVLMLVAAAGSICFTLVGKPAFARTRPPLGDAVPPYEDSFSFPSGHTLNSTVVAGMLAYLVVWLSTVMWVRVAAVLAAAVWAVPMGFSRVFLGHHWLTDVMFGWAVGLAWLALLITVHQTLLHLRARRRPGSA